MKIYLLSCALSFLLLACTNNTNKAVSPAADTAKTNTGEATRPRTECFQRVSGNNNRDTSTLKIVIENDIVVGRLVSSIYEKDKRAGDLKGVFKDGTLTATWYFMQEGVKDSLPVAFKFHDNGVIQKEYSINSATGKEELKEGAPFHIRYEPIECAP